MKAEVMKLEGLTHKLNVEVPPEAVQNALDDMYAAVQRVTEIKGFRKGKVPLPIIKTHYKEKVEQDVISKLIQDHYGLALGEHSLVPIQLPEIEFDGLKEGEPLRFTATFEVRPDVSLKKYKGLEVRREQLQIKPESVDHIIEELRKSKASLVPVLELRAAQMGDVVVIDFVGTAGGLPIQDGSAQEYSVELGSNRLIPGFEEGVVGMSVGAAKTLHLQFPEKYGNEELAGQAATFQVTLRELKKKVLPEVNDDFAKTMGHDSIAHLREEVLKDVTKGEESRIRDDLKTNILKVLVTQNPFEVPKSMVQRQKETLIDDLHHRMEQDGMPHDKFEEYKVKWDQDFEKTAEFTVRSGYLISTISNEEKLQATEEEITQRMDSYAQRSGIEIEKIKAHYSKEENLSRLRFQITEEKVMDLLISNAIITDVSREELQNQ